MLIKGANYLEALAGVDTVVFDKTGTLTKGSFKVTEIHANGIAEGELLALAAAAESFSSHPVARSIVSAYGAKPEKSRVSDAHELAGKGIEATVDGEK